MDVLVTGARVYRSFKVPFRAAQICWSFNSDTLFAVDVETETYSVDIRGNVEFLGIRGDQLFVGPHSELVIANSRELFLFDQDSGNLTPEIELLSVPDRVDFGSTPRTAVVWDAYGEGAIIDFESASYILDDSERVDVFTGEDEVLFDESEYERYAPELGAKWTGVYEHAYTREVTLNDEQVRVNAKDHEFRIESPTGYGFEQVFYTEATKYGTIATEDQAGNIFVFSAASPSSSCRIANERAATRNRLVGFNHNGSVLAVYVETESECRVRLYKSDALEEVLTQNLSTYRNAKIVLAGDTGVGKSGLFLRLTRGSYQATDSTHSRDVALIEQSDDGNEVREVYLWDLAGQPGYRVFHQLSLRDISVGAIVFDSRDDADSLRSVRFWAKSIESASSSNGLVPIVLVGARSDRGVPLVTQEEIETSVGEFAVLEYVETSAKNNEGIGRLRDLMISSINWDDCPAIVAPNSFFDLRARLIEVKNRLDCRFISEEALLNSVGDEASAPGRAVTRLALKRLEAAGVIVKLARRDLWLLEPELLDSIVSSMAMAARADEQGLGQVSLDKLRLGEFPHEVLTNSVDEDLLLNSAVAEVVERRLACQVDTDLGAVLVFPTAFRVDTPYEVPASDLYCSIEFAGPVTMIYSAVTIRLIATLEFGTRPPDLFRNGAHFHTDSGGRCGYFLDYGSDESTGVLNVFFEPSVGDLVRARFIMMLRRQVEKLASGRSCRIQRVYSHCGVLVDQSVIEGAMARSRQSIFCGLCGYKIELSVVDSNRLADVWATQKLEAADRANAREVRLLRRDANQSQRLFQTFLCYNTVDRPDVTKLYQDLFEEGIVPWMDVKCDLGRSDAIRRIDQLVSTVPTALICLGPSFLGKFQEHEYHAFVHRAIYSEGDGHSFRLAVILLPGSEVARVPSLLAPYRRFDLSRPGTRDQEMAALVQFVES